MQMKFEIAVPIVTKLKLNHEICKGATKLDLETMIIHIQGN